MGAAKATVLEKKWPFKSIAEKPYFITAGNAMGGQIYNGFIGSMMNRGGSAQESAAADEESKEPAPAAKTNVKSFSGQGVSIGGAPIEAPRFDSAGASATRGRSTPATRAASMSSASDSGAKSSNPSSRPGNALIAKLEEKKRMETLGNESALTTEDVGYDMNPQERGHNAPDKGADDDVPYIKVNETGDSV